MTKWTSLPICVKETIPLPYWYGISARMAFRTTAVAKPDYCSTAKLRASRFSLMRVGAAV
ncbi:hypothetical protein [Bacteroides faecalis]|uniref:hypothetical protein n=1 Tax=Bacteroides faecalis TaxID=2447885 RepID=UPI00190FB5D2|nr:hypothetical protein [Bacteroides faecalis]